MANRSNRLDLGAGDMLRSVAVLLVVLGVVAFFTWDWNEEQPDPVNEVDYTTELNQVERIAPYVVLAPEGLEGWRATSVRFTDGTGDAHWHLGFVTPGECPAGPGCEYVGLEQAVSSPGSFVDQFAEESQPDGQSTVDGVVWERLLLDGGEERALLRTEGDSVTFVEGTADYETLEEFVAALR